jgi:hypothetical protein
MDADSTKTCTTNYEASRWIRNGWYIAPQRHSLLPAVTCADMFTSNATPRIVIQYSRSVCSNHSGIFLNPTLIHSWKQSKAELCNFKYLPPEPHYWNRQMYTVKCIEHQAMKSGCVDPPILTSALSGQEWSASCPRGNSTRYPWVAPGAGLGVTQMGIISCPWRESNPDSSVVQPVASSLYRLSYPCSK